MVQAGKHPGKTNLTDLDNGLNIIKWLQRKPAAVILKHNNPCGAAWADSLAAAYDKANMADRIAAFGGAAVFNRPVDKATAELVAQNYLEVLAAPDFEAGTLDILKKAKDLRIIKIPRFERLVELIHHRFVDFKCLVDGGIIVQQSPLNAIRGQDDFKPAVATHKGQEYRCVRQPSAAEYEDLLFGWWVEQGITSNSVIFVKDGVHRGHRHRRTGPGGGGGDRGLQGLHQVRRRPVLPAVRHALQEPGDWKSSRPSGTHRTRPTSTWPPRRPKAASSARP